MQGAPVPRMSRKTWDTKENNGNRCLCFWMPLLCSESIDWSVSARNKARLDILRFRPLRRGSCFPHWLARHKRRTPTAIRRPGNARQPLGTHQWLLEIPSYWTSANESNRGKGKVVRYASSGQIHNVVRNHFTVLHHQFICVRFHLWCRFMLVFFVACTSILPWQSARRSM